MTKEQFYSTANPADLCKESDDFIALNDTFDESWDTCTEPQWLIRGAVMLGHDISWIRNEDVPNVNEYMNKFDESDSMTRKLIFISSIIDIGYDSNFCDIIRKNITL